MTSDEKQKLLRVGIMGAARIARKNCLAINSSSISNCVVSAIASRDYAKGKQFVLDNLSDCNDSIHICKSYEDLLTGDFCDAVYIPLPTSLHKEWVIKALRAGKHVLVEKPVAINADEYKDMIDVAKSNDKHLQDGTMFVHNSRFKSYLKAIRSKDFGGVDRVHSDFSFRGNADFFFNDIRCSARGDPLGCVGDLGWYCIRAAISIFSRGNSYIKATKVSVVHAHCNEEGVPLDVTCLVYFKENILSFHCSFLHGLRQNIETRGSKSTAVMNDFVIPTAKVPSFEVHSMTLSELDAFAIETNELVVCERSPTQESLMWKKFEKIARGLDGDRDSDETGTEAMVLTEMSLHAQEICDAILKSIRLGCVNVDLI